MLQIIKRPLLTEKAMSKTDQGQYVFEVNPNANKVQIRQAIEEMFEVNITSIRTARIKGKYKRRYTRRGLMEGRTNLRKKAYVTLQSGQAIELVSGVQGEN